MNPPAPQTFLQSVFTAMRVALNPETFFLQQLRTGKDTFFLSMPGLNQVMMTTTPAGAREIFHAADDVLTSSLPNPIEPLLGRKSLILLQGDAHARERRLLKPAFQGACLRSYMPLMQEAITKKLESISGSPVVDMRAFMHELTLDVIIEVVFGARDAQMHALYECAIQRLMKSFTPPLMLMPFLRRRFAGAGPWDRFLAAKQHFDDLLDEEIKRARAPNASPRQDILASLATMTDEAGRSLESIHLQNELTTLLAAGHETTANTLLWAVYLLSTHAEVMEKLTAEIVNCTDNDIGSIMKLPYLDATLKEVLRLHPVVPLVMRSTLQPCTLLGYTLTADRYVGIATYALHMNELVWQKPMQFRPERFLERDYSAYEFVPFGGGNKKCLGYGFALFEMKLALFGLLSRKRLTLQSSKRVSPAIQGITVGPRQAIRMQLTDR